MRAAVREYLCLHWFSGEAVRGIISVTMPEIVSITGVKFHTQFEPVQADVTAKTTSSTHLIPLATFSHPIIALFGELYSFHSDKFPDPLPHVATQILVSRGGGVELRTNNWNHRGGQDCLLWCLS